MQVQQGRKSHESIIKLIDAHVTNKSIADVKWEKVKICAHYLPT